MAQPALLLAISGKGFSPKTSENQVIIGSTEVRVVSANAHRLIVKVPGHLKGTVPVSVKVKEQSSNVAFLRYPLRRYPGRRCKTLKRVNKRKMHPSIGGCIFSFRQVWYYSFPFRAPQHF